MKINCVSAHPSPCLSSSLNLQGRFVVEKELVSCFLFLFYIVTYAKAPTQRTLHPSIPTRSGTRSLFEADNCLVTKH